MIAGPTVFGGRGCLAAGPNAGPDAVRRSSPPPASAIPAGPGEEKTVVFSRGGCFFSTKIAAGQDLGYDAVIIGQSHGGTRNGLLPDAFFCGGQGHDYDEQIPAICIGHRAMHLMFNDTPEYTGAEGLDIPLGTLGASYTASTEFDGWGYVQLHDARDPNLAIIDSYAVPEALDEGFAETWGILSVHEVKTDPRPNKHLAYISYYNAGARVVKFSKRALEEVGFFIDEGGNHFWGTFPHQPRRARERRSCSSATATSASTSSAIRDLAASRRRTPNVMRRPPARGPASFSSSTPPRPCPRPEPCAAPS